MTTQFRNSRGGGYATSAMSRATPPSSNPYAQGYVRQQPQFNPYAYRPPQPVQQPQQPAKPMYPPPPQQLIAGTYMPPQVPQQATPLQPVIQPPQQSYPSPTMDFLQNTVAPQPVQPVTQPPQQQLVAGTYMPPQTPQPYQPLVPVNPAVPRPNSGLFASMEIMSPGFSGAYDPNVPFSGYTRYNI